MFCNPYDSNLYKFIDIQAHRITKVIAEFSSTENLSIFCKNIKDFSRLQNILNDFGITRYTIDDSKYDVADYLIYVNFPFDYKYSNFIVVLESDCNEFNWFTTNASNLSGMDIDLFIDRLLKESAFATHKDQDGYLWKPSAFTPDWYCFVNNTWIKLELEEHVKLISTL